MRTISDGDTNLRVVGDLMVLKTIGPDETCDKMGGDRQHRRPRAESRAVWS